MDKNNNINFINNPNLKEKKYLCKIDYISGFNDLFDIYTPINNNITKEQYIIYSDENFCLNISELKTLKIIKILKGHKNHVTQIKYYNNKKSIKYNISGIDIEDILKKNEENENEENNKNINEEKGELINGKLNEENNINIKGEKDNKIIEREDNEINKEINEKKIINKNNEETNSNVDSIKDIKNNKNIDCEEYIISSDMSGIVILWNINNSYNIEFIIKSNYQNYIYSILILFNINNYNFIVTSTLGRFNNRIDFSKLYLLSNGKFVKNIYGTNHNNTTFIIPWYNKKNDEIYLIEFCRYNISINNILKEEVYHIFGNKKEYNKYYSGFIYTKNEKDYLVSCSYNGNVDIWNLFDKKIEKYIMIKYSRMHSILSWNEKYFIVGDYNKGEIIIIELSSLKIVSIIKNKNIKNIISLKKIKHSLYNECLLILSADGNINLLDTI